MLDDNALATVKAINAIQQKVPDVATQLQIDPTSFVTETLQDAGIAVSDGFHVHLINEGESLPDEPIVGTQDRDIYLLRLDERIKHMRIKGDPSSNNDELLHAAGDNCHCIFDCVVVEKPDPKPSPTP